MRGHFYSESVYVGDRSLCSTEDKFGLRWILEHTAFNISDTTLEFVEACANISQPTHCKLTTPQTFKYSDGALL